MSAFPPALSLTRFQGRQLDHAPPPLATLVRLHLEQPALLKDPKFAVFIDGGVSRGTEYAASWTFTKSVLLTVSSSVLKALCLGAKGVGLGRVTLYAQVRTTLSQKARMADIEMLPDVLRRRGSDSRHRE